jgi:alpha/beta superfamily hydrolase
MGIASTSSERVSIPGPAGRLEAVVVNASGAAGADRDAGAGHSADARDAAGTSGAAGARFAVICHPHPLSGGTMDNKVVTTLAKALQSTGLATLRFNFRGVGDSEGAYDQGVGETQDAQAVAAYGAARWPGAPPVLAGFSFGAFVALRLALELDVARLIAVAPPVGRFDFSGLTAPKCPWLIVQGDADEVVDAQGVIAWAKSLHPQPTLAVLPGVGHFFHGHLAALRDAVIETLRS